jgi:ParB/RepB/Spo0J family partition protein
MVPVQIEGGEIEIKLINVGRQRLREVPSDDSIGELAESIAAKGLLQPIGVSLVDNGRYQLRWGHRRYLAHVRLKRKTIRATLYDGPEESIKGLALVENLHRSQMTLDEEVRTVMYLQDIERKSVEQIAAIVNKGRAWVLDRLMVTSLALFLSEPLLAGDLPLSHVEVIARVPDESAQRYLVGMCIQNRWNKSQLKQIAQCYMQGTSPAEPSGDGIPGVRPNVAAAAFLYLCELCEEKGTLDQFDLVRVHKDGSGCRAVPSGSDPASSGGNGVEG